LLPRGKPTAALICEYDGQNSTPEFGLADRVMVGAAGAAKIAAAASRLPVEHQDNVETSCPADDGALDAIAFAYPGRPDVDLGFAATGCQAVENGHIVVEGGLNLKPWIAPIAP
jgi:hypothetical protein